MSRRSQFHLLALTAGLATAPLWGWTAPTPSYMEPELTSWSVSGSSQVASLDDPALRNVARVLTEAPESVTPTYFENVEGLLDGHLQGSTISSAGVQTHYELRLCPPDYRLSWICLDSQSFLIEPAAHLSGRENLQVQAASLLVLAHEAAGKDLGPMTPGAMLRVGVLGREHDLKALTEPAVVQVLRELLPAASGPPEGFFQRVRERLPEASPTSEIQAQYRYEVDTVDEVPHGRRLQHQELRLSTTGVNGPMTLRVRAEVNSPVARK